MVHSIGKTIAELRKAKGWTQIELAEKLQVSDKAVSKWEQEGGVPSVEFFPALAEVFGVTIDYLMTGKKIDNVNLDDMDATKRMYYLIEKDDAENYIKYGHVKKTYFDDFPKGTENTPISSIIKNNSFKIFNACVNAGITLKPNNYSASTFVGALYEHIDELVKLACLSGSIQFLEKIDIRSFGVGSKASQLRNNSSVRIIHSSFNHTYDKNTAYLISDDVFDLIYNDKRVPNDVVEYISTYIPFNSKNVRVGTTVADYGRVNGVFYFLEQNIVTALYSTGRFELLHKYIDAIKEDSLKTISAYNNRGSDYGYHIGYKVTPSNYLIRTDTGSYGLTTILGKCISISPVAIQAAVNKSDKEWINIFNNYNKALVSEINGKLDYSPYVLTDSEIERHLLLKSDISDKEKSKIKCVKDNILQVYEIKQLEDLKLAREIINSGYYNHFEIACECVKTDNYKALFELLIDLDCQDSANKLLTAPKTERVDVAYNLFRFFANKTNNIDKKIMDTYAQEARKMTLGLDTSTKSDELRKTWGLNVEKYCIEKMHDYILEQKELLYKHVKDKVDAKAKAEQDAKDRAKIIMDLDNAHFSELIGRNEIRLFVLDLCSLFDAILKFDYKIEGEDFFARMTKYFDNGPKTRYCDDGWGYSVVDSKYEQEEVIPWQAKRELFNRLRIQRNNIAHSESNKVQELTLKELADCLEFVFSLKKEIK